MRGHEELMRLTIFALLGAVALMGCDNTTGSGGGTSGSAIQPAPDFPSNSGEAAHPTKAYPAPPYGVGKGSTVANYKFVGYADAQMVNNALQEIELAEFYNPTGNGTYDKGSVLGEGLPKPKVILIDVASVWCGPCNEEAQNVLPKKHALYKPGGGEFLLNLADGPTPGKAATSKSLYNWTYKYKVDFPAAIDPTYKLGALFVQEAFPTNMIIDTTTMKIIAVVAEEVVPGNCSDMSVCWKDADCNAGSCTPLDFWVTYEKYLDKTRAGCTVK